MEILYGQMAPEDQEVAAIIAAAVHQLMSSSKSSSLPLKQDDTNWRFSGRWWNKPVTARSRPSY
ncbi:MAG: hypothetical protein M1288_01585 [Actinobacteria bacterium]|nr:hypothetical protein [Actinomycetota bacterium]